MMYLTKQQQGFTIIEMMIAVAVVAILAAIALPNYQEHVRKVKRTDMMNEMQSLAGRIESRKLTLGRDRSSFTASDLEGAYPQQGSAVYQLVIDTTSNGYDKWVMTATPTAEMQKQDGVLSLAYDGKKCRDSACGYGDEWRQ